MKSKYKSTTVKLTLIILITTIPFYYALLISLPVKGAEPSLTTGTTIPQQNALQQPCICPELEENYSSCLKELIKTNVSLQSCLNVTYYSVVNQMYQEITNINNKITIISFCVVLNIGISFFTLFKSEIVALSVKLVKKIKGKKEEVGL
jgi:hypothetical protein